MSESGIFLQFVHTEGVYAEWYDVFKLFLKILDSWIFKKKTKRIQLKPSLKNISTALKQISLASSHLYSIILLIGAFLDTYSSAL